MPTFVVTDQWDAFVSALEREANSRVTRIITDVCNEMGEAGLSAESVRVVREHLRNLYADEDTIRLLARGGLYCEFRKAVWVAGVNAAAVLEGKGNEK